MESQGKQLQAATESQVAPGQAAAGASKPAAYDMLARAVLTRLSAAGGGGTSSAPDVPEGTIRAFCTMLLCGDAPACIDFSRHLSRRATDYACLSDTLFAEAARRLGSRWETDDLSFWEVSLGISTLMRVHNELRARARPTADCLGPRVLFATLPSQAHTLGIILAAEAFRQAGWHVEMLFDADPQALQKTVADAAYGLVGLTAARDGTLAKVTEAIGMLRASASPPRILLGGIAPVQIEDAIRKTGADIVVCSIDEALREGLEQHRAWEAEHCRGSSL